MYPLFQPVDARGPNEPVTNVTTISGINRSSNRLTSTMSIKQIGYAISAFGIFLATIVAIALRLLKVAPSHHLDGWMYVTTYPAVAWAVVIGIVVAILGLMVTLVGKAIN